MAQVVFKSQRLPCFNSRVGDGRGAGPMGIWRLGITRSETVSHDVLHQSHSSLKEASGSVEDLRKFPQLNLHKCPTSLALTQQWASAEASPSLQLGAYLQSSPVVGKSDFPDRSPGSPLQNTAKHTKVLVAIPVTLTDPAPRMISVPSGAISKSELATCKGKLRHRGNSFGWSC